MKTITRNLGISMMALLIAALLWCCNGGKPVYPGVSIADVAMQGLLARANSDSGDIHGLVKQASVMRDLDQSLRREVQKCQCGATIMAQECCPCDPPGGCCSCDGGTDSLTNYFAVPQIESLKFNGPTVIPVSKTQKEGFNEFRVNLKGLEDADYKLSIMGTFEGGEVVIDVKLRNQKLVFEELNKAPKK